MRWALNTKKWRLNYPHKTQSRQVIKENLDNYPFWHLLQMIYSPGHVMKLKANQSFITLLTTEGWFLQYPERVKIFSSPRSIPFTTHFKTVETIDVGLMVITREQGFINCSGSRLTVEIFVLSLLESLDPFFLQKMKRPYLIFKLIILGYTIYYKILLHFLTPACFLSSPCSERFLYNNIGGSFIALQF